MKKTLVILLILALSCAVLAGCSASGPVPGDQEAPPTQGGKTEPGTVPSSAPAVTAAPQAEIPDFSEDDLESKDYLYENDVSVRAFRVVKNNSEATVKINGTVTVKDAAGKELGKVDAGVTYLSPGDTSLIQGVVWNVSDAASAEFALNYQVETFFTSGLAGMTVENIVNDKGVTALVTNNGEYDALGAGIFALFFDASGKIVHAEQNVIGDRNNRIPAGTRAAQRFNGISEEYDHVEIYLKAYADGSKTEAPTQISEADLAVREIPLFASNGLARWFLLITNNSKTEAGIRINAVAYDKNGAKVGAMDTEISVLAAGQTGICSVGFEGAGEIDHLEYAYSFDTEPMTKDARPFLTVDTQSDGKGVDVAVTNNGSSPAGFVSVYVLFFDEQGTCIGVQQDFVRDDDGELKNGETLSIRLEARNPFAKAEVYLMGGTVQ